MSIARVIRLLATAASTMAVMACEDTNGSRMSSRNPPAEFDHAEILTATLTGEVVSRGEYLGLPTDLLFLPPYLVIGDQASEHRIHVITAEGGRRVVSFGARGAGPGEFRAGPKLVRSPENDDSSFWAFDVTPGRLTKYSLSGIESGAPAAADIISLSFPSFAYHLEWLSDSTVAMLGFFEGGRYATGDAGTGDMILHGSRPGDADVPAAVAQHAHQATMKLNPSRTKLAIASLKSSDFRIYDVAASTHATAAAPFAFEVDYDVVGSADRPQYRAGWKNRYGYLSISAGSNLLWALFSGRSEEAFSGEEDRGEYVHVFSYDGAIVAALKLDRSVINVQVDPAESTMYAIALDPEPMILRYSIPASAVRNQR